CLNVVTEAPGRAGAVLVRAIEPVRSLARWRARRPDLPLHLVASGPGRVTRALGLTRAHDGLDLTRSPLVIVRREGPHGPIGSGTRVGIRRAVEQPWRFWLASSPSISRARGSAAGPFPEPVHGRA
ncbi:MAG: DNA-3-methyladenine glycosylase, partial [Candidatus Eiseniibacteriota bacterium]